MGIVEEIANKIHEVIEQGLVPEYIVLNPESAAQLLADTRFIDASKYGNQNGTFLRNGEIGKIFGLPVIIVTKNDSRSPAQYFEENENPSSRDKLKPRGMIIVSD